MLVTILTLFGVACVTVLAVLALFAMLLTRAQGFFYRRSVRCTLTHRWRVIRFFSAGPYGGRHGGEVWECKKCGDRWVVRF